MTELLWKSAGSVFASEVAGVRLVIACASTGGYRYQLLRRAGAVHVSIASGYQEDLRDAMAAAERTARGFTPAPRSTQGGSDGRGTTGQP